MHVIGLPFEDCLRLHGVDYFLSHSLLGFHKNKTGQVSVGVFEHICLCVSLHNAMYN